MIYVLHVLQIHNIHSNVSILLFFYSKVNVLGLEIGEWNIVIAIWFYSTNTFCFFCPAYLSIRYSKLHLTFTECSKWTFPKQCSCNWIDCHVFAKKLYLCLIMLVHFIIIIVIRLHDFRLKLSMSMNTVIDSFIFYSAHGWNNKNLQYICVVHIDVNDVEVIS